MARRPTSVTKGIRRDPAAAAAAADVEIDGVLAPLGRDPPAGGEVSLLIPALQAVQARLGFLPPETFARVGAHFNIPDARVYGVATFYAQFYLTRQGRHKIKVCRGTACHVRESGPILTALEDELGIKTGETTPDLKFTLERVACFGSCALAPVVVVDDEVHGRMTRKKTLKLVDALE